MNRDQAFVLAGEIVRLVEDLMKECSKEISDDFVKMYGTGSAHFGTANPRNWNDTVVNALPTRSFREAVWADVFRVQVGRAPMRESSRMEAFIEKWRDVIAEWELLGSVGE